MKRKTNNHENNQLLGGWLCQHLETNVYNKWFVWPASAELGHFLSCRYQKDRLKKKQNLKFFLYDVAIYHKISMFQRNNTPWLISVLYSEDKNVEYLEMK